MKNIFLCFQLILSTTLLGASGLENLELEVLEANEKAHRFIKNGKIKLSTLKDKKILFVNIATRCGYTPQLKALEKLYNQYKDKNFVLIGVPSNDFMSQTPEDGKDIVEFCKKNYDVSFPIISKRKVKGEEKDVLYKELVSMSGQDEISWNFEKILIGKNLKFLKRFSPSKDPLSTELTKLIESSNN